MNPRRPGPTKGTPVQNARPLIVGLDIGSTVVKAAVFDRRGRTLATSARAVRISLPAPGRVERDPEATWRAVAAALRKVAAIAGRGDRIAAVGVTGCGNGAVWLDAAGRAIGPGILASDTRAAAFTCPREYPGQTAVLLRWLRAEQPRLARRVSRVAFWKDFVRLRLTGQFCTEPTDLGAAGWGARSTEPLLPPRVASLAIAGHVTPAAARATGLRAGTPVVAGCIDCEAAAIGSGVSAPGALSLVAGTWSINQCFVPAPPSAAKARGLFLVNPSAMPGRSLVLEASPDSAGHLDWFVRAVRGRGDFARLARIASACAADGPVFVPGLFGRGAVFAGLRPHHDLAARARAVMPGVVFAHRAHVEKLRAAGLRFRRARLAGGATRSDFWCQLFADTLGLPVEVPAGDEIGALGAALCAGVGVGVWPNLRAAQKATVRVARAFKPDSARAAEFSSAYRHFLRIRTQFPS
ncbi:MAG: FGGY-family carbohydrate kinase [Opitutaceae bacterium]